MAANIKDFPPEVQKQIRKKLAEENSSGRRSGARKGQEVFSSSPRKGPKRKVVFYIDYPENKGMKAKWAKWYGLNSIYSGKPYHQRSKDKNFWTDMVRATLYRQKVPKKIFERPVSISFWWNTNLDLDNEGYMRKLIIDALKGWLIFDDRLKYVRALHDYPHDEDYIKVLVEEL